MDRQGLDAILLFPTLGVGVEQGLRHDPEAAMHCVSAFNRWLEEDWGFGYQERIFSAPLLSLADPVAALAELDSLIERGSILVLRHHVWVTPYYEEDIRALAETIGVDKVLFGSDWPHGEGLAEPVTFTKELTGFSADDVRKIMRGNVLEYLGGQARPGLMMAARPQQGAPRAIDCLVNVHFGDSEQPEYMFRVKNEYFKKDDSIFGKWDLPKVLDEMDANGVQRAVLPESLLHYMRTRGKAKVIFASDAPVLSITRTIGEAMALDLPEAVRDNYLYGNAQRFFFDRLDEGMVHQ
jgi:Amidohydrolase